MAATNVFTVLYRYDDGADTRVEGVYKSLQEAAEGLGRAAAFRDLAYLQGRLLGGTTMALWGHDPATGCPEYRGIDEEGNEVCATYDVTDTHLISFTTDFGFSGRIEAAILREGT